ncbi:MAG: hypothetical protein L0G27_12510 [Paracoccus sp. (in: a-proteobacteria)]|nr:hypothetical protein [Paracoccus sp. (in: a-proteobacteria)]
MIQWAVSPRRLGPDLSQEIMFAEPRLFPWQEKGEKISGNNVGIDRQAAPSLPLEQNNALKWRLWIKNFHYPRRHLLFGTKAASEWLTVNHDFVAQIG